MQLERNAPAAGGITAYQPVRMDHHRLVHQFKTPLGVADRLDRERPPGRGLIGDQTHVDAEPLVDHAQLDRIFQVQLGVQRAESRVVSLVEEPILGVGRESGEIELHAEVQRPIRRQSFEQIGDLERGAAGFRRHPLGDLDGNAAGPSLACQQDLNPVRDSAESASRTRSPGNLPAARHIRPARPAGWCPGCRSGPACSCADAGRTAVAGPALPA